MKQLRVGLLSAYFGMYDDVMPADFRDQQRAIVGRIVSALAGSFSVLDLGMISSDAEGVAAARSKELEQAHVIVYAPTMVAPPAWLLHVIRVTSRPVVIWNALAISSLPADMSHTDATVHTSQVGCLMLANCLVRENRWFATVTCALSDEVGLERVRRTVRAAATAGAMGGLRALRVGDPIPGYDDVFASEASLIELGIVETHASPAELTSAFADVSDAQARTLLERLKSRAGWRFDTVDEQLRSSKLALALQRLFAQHGAACGTLNCHGVCFRENPAIGITACLGMSLLGEVGVPVSCTGDLPAGLSMFLAERLSGRALYCETYTPELDTGLTLIASGGDGDPRWAQAGRIDTIANHYYRGRNGAGIGLSFAIEPGPATLISLSPAGKGWRLAWATGEVVGTRYAHLDGPNGMFRFDREPLADAASQWIASGATHHHALAKGRLDLELPIVAAALGILSVRV